MSIPVQTPPSSSSIRSVRSYAWVFDVLLLAVLLAGLYFRSVGIDWDQNEHLHPDERFLTWATSDLLPVDSLADYFDTANSTLNPHNRGFGFFVYGTLPIFLTRYVGEWLGQTGYDQIHLVGRQLSGIADLLTVFLVYLAAARLYNRRTGLLAAAFSACAVLQIQLSHYYTVDTFTNLFTFLAIYLAIVIMTQKSDPVGWIHTPRRSAVVSADPQDGPRAPSSSAATTTRVEIDERVESVPILPAYGWREILKETIPYALFGVALGMAMASKVSAAPLAIVLPLAAAIRWFQLPAEDRRRRFLPVLFSLAVAALVSFISFRIFQPYAFTGPGFFGIKINPLWLENLRSLSAQSSSDAPFALQWARRPIWFALQNLVLWGFGLPLGVLAWSGFAWMGWRIFKGEWTRHALIWGWTLIYFTWQSLSPTKTMRYQLLIYPTLAIIAAWGIWALWEKGRAARQARSVSSGNGHPTAIHEKSRVWPRIAAGVLGITVLAATAAWAFAFTRIYTRPVTRIAASEWIYQNVPGSLNVRYETDSGELNQPLSYSYGRYLAPGESLQIVFRPQTDGYLMNLKLEHVLYQGPSDVANPESRKLNISIAPADAPGQVMGSTVVNDPFTIKSDSLGDAYDIAFNSPIPLVTTQSYLLTLELAEAESGLRLMGTPSLAMMNMDRPAITYQPLPVLVNTITRQTPYVDQFRAWYSGTVREISLPHIADLLAGSQSKTLVMSITGAMASGEIETVTATLRGAFVAGEDPRGEAGVFLLDRPVEIVADNIYSVVIELTEGDGDLAVYGSIPAFESTWDDFIPRNLGRVSALEPFHSVYRDGLNFEMYWDDNPEKLNRFLSILEQADYVVITSNRQWATIPRVPERYPLTTAYYRDLLGCPSTEDILTCYRDAQPGMYIGRLGFELAYVAQSDPNLGSVRFNTQYAEEAFTVYDHPKVLIFKKTGAYDRAQVREILSAVNTDEVLHVTPAEAVGNSLTMMLPDFRWAIQQAGGTWSRLFDVDALQNRYPALTVVFWYLAVSLLGLIAYPLLRLALPGLADRGYPFARIAGMLLLSYFVWLPGSLGVPVTRLMITQVVVILALIAALLAYRQRDELAAEWRGRKKYFLLIEGLTLAFFAIDLAVRLGNPDLWHPWKGGERPMDFSYLNAVIKSTTFPPYDPWYAGGYLNYYYYGYVIVGAVVKWLGIVPSVAFNLILPTLFSMVALGAFSIGWNLMSRKTPRDSLPQPDEVPTEGTFQAEQPTPPVAQSSPLFGKPFFTGMASAAGMLILGNLGTVRMIWYGLQRLVAPGGNTDGATIFSKLIWTVQGLIAYARGANMPYYPGDWYWIPSRAIVTPAGNEITEFPAFTFLYGDLHPHVIAMPLTLLALAWVISLVLARGRWGEPGFRHHRRLSTIASFGFGALVVGSLRPTNTWDFYTYIALSVVALGYVSLRYARPTGKWLKHIHQHYRAAICALVRIAVFGALALLLFKPYADWYQQGYSKLILWDGIHTPFWSYLTHWGLFLFVIVSWMAWETREWMASTPMSALNRLKPYRGFIQGGLVLLAVVCVALALSGVWVGWLIVLLGMWATILLLRPEMPDSKRLILFLFGTGLVITLFVEGWALQGDPGRQNVVFKFYLQVWTLFAICAAAGLGWLVDAAVHWRPRVAYTWQIALTLLVAATALFPLMGGLDKIRDRMALEAPHSLDGMGFMPYAEYGDDWGTMDLGQDYEAIRWLQENVSGSPVIVEANLRNLYRWGSRMTVYTGLPGVVGWEWHQQQQRAVVPTEWVTNRVFEIEDFYTTTDPDIAKSFLQRYNVEYIILGQQERGKYAGAGISKFADYDGVYWRSVYVKGDTVIYQVDCNCSPAAVTQR